MAAVIDLILVKPAKMSRVSSSTLQFEDVVRRILEANLFTIQPPDALHPGRDLGFDFKALLRDEVWAIEVKFYRTARAQVSLLEAAASRVAAGAFLAGASKAMLVVSCWLSPSVRGALEGRFSLTFVDRFDLRVYARTPEQLDELNSLLETDPEGTVEQATRAVPSIEGSKPLTGHVPPEDTEGSDLCKELRGLKPGKGAWLRYEHLCDRILKYLFANDLHGWHRQIRTDDGLNRYDYICRIRPTTEFWRFLIDHLDSRYVLFEFKNYTGKIKQGQVLTTEKYLLERGLRRVAVIFTRAGADPNAILMTQGAMREHGKLMLIVDDDQVCEMLHMKERGDDPTDCLFELADDFLLSLPR